MKTARSQAIGGITMGIGMALMEATRIDPNNGRVVNANVSDYLMPVHADIPDLQTILIEEQDRMINPAGVKGIGELPIVGAAAAVANAVYHATGIRVRDLPILAEKILVV
jgi:xanthine dehydrogenase YagR molybdenum-binding subunit